MRTPCLSLCILSIAPGCSPLPSVGDSADGTAKAECTLTDDARTLLLDNATGLMGEVAYVGQATESVAQPYLYAISLYDQVSAAGESSFAGCADPTATFEASCGERGTASLAYWSCAQPSCVDSDTVQVDAWYTTTGNTEIGDAAPFSIDATSTGGILSFSKDPVHTWILDSSEAYTTVYFSHAVSAQHTGVDGVISDVSYEATGTISHGSRQPSVDLEITYPHLETGHRWSMTLSSEAGAVAGALLRDGAEVGAVTPLTPAAVGDPTLALRWEGCAEDVPPPLDTGSVPCPKGTGAGCEPGRV